MYNHFTYPIVLNQHSEAYYKKIRCEAVALCAEPIKALSYHNFIMYEETGSRVEYEAEYFQHRKMLCAFGAMALLNEDEKWLEKLCDIIWAVCDEYTWALPAHIYRLYDQNDAVNIVKRIDLFSAETSMALAELYHILDSVLPSPVKARIIYEIKRRIVTPYLTDGVSFPPNNWSAVCGCGVGASIIYLGLTNEFEQVKEKLMHHMQDFLSSYFSDGCCMEGSLYWSYGFSFFCWYAELLRQYTNGDVNLFCDEKVKRIAFFGQNAYLQKNYVLPFSDSPHTLNYHSGLYALLAEKYDGILQPESRYEIQFGDDVRFRLPTLLRDLYWGKQSDAAQEDKRCIYYADAGWYINKMHGYVFAAKAGCNAEPHNHNDIGSFLLLDDNQFILDDVGWPEYTKDYFGKLRYQNPCASSLGHSLPIIDETPQGCGKEYFGKVLSYDEHSFCLDMTAAYTLPALSELKRCFHLLDNGIRICDSAKGECRSFTERFVTRIPPEQDANGVRLGNYLLRCNRDAEIVINSFTFMPRFHSFMEGEDIHSTAYTVDFEFKDFTSTEFELLKA